MRVLERAQQAESVLELTMRAVRDGERARRSTTPKRVMQHAGRIGIRTPVPACDPGEAKSRAQELDELAFVFVTTETWFWKLFVRFVQDAREAEARIGAKAVVERIRWEHTMRASLQKHDFRVNNTLAASIARIYVRTYPEHEACFEMRERPSAQARARGGIA